MPYRDPSLHAPYKVALRLAKKERAIKYKGGKCSHCHGVYPPCVYDFHHIDPSTKVNRLDWFFDKSWEKILPELDKCILLCSNCHRVEHNRLFRSLRPNKGKTMNERIDPAFQPMDEEARHAVVHNDGTISVPIVEGDTYIDGVRQPKPGEKIFVQDEEEVI